MDLAVQSVKEKSYQDSTIQKPEQHCRVYQRFIKNITKPALGFGNYQAAAIMLPAIETIRMIRKSQRDSDVSKSTPEQF